MHFHYQTDVTDFLAINFVYKFVYIDAKTAELCIFKLHAYDDVLIFNLLQ